MASCNRWLYVGASLFAVLAAPSVWAQPSTFNTTIGNAVLCLNELDPEYFYRYLTREFGAPYQHQGGAWWFRTPKTELWNVPVTAVVVSDGRGDLLFLSAETAIPPDKLSQAITADAGIEFTKGDRGVYPVLVSNTGSMIAYEHTGSKIYCAKSKRLFRIF